MKFLLSRLWYVPVAAAMMLATYHVAKAAPAMSTSAAAASDNFLAVVFFAMCGIGLGLAGVMYQRARKEAFLRQLTEDYQMYKSPAGPPSDG